MAKTTTAGEKRERDEPAWNRFAEWLFAMALFGAPLISLSAASDSFRLPKRVAAEVLVSFAIAFAAGYHLRRRGTAVFSDLWKRRTGQAAILVSVPLFLAAVLSSRHDLSFAALVRVVPFALIVPFAMSLRSPKFDRLAETAILFSGAITVVIVLAQAGQIWNPITFVNPDDLRTRAAVVGWIGNAGTLGIFLMAPLAISIRRALLGDRKMVILAVATFGAIAASATFTAVGGAILGAGLLLVSFTKELTRSPGRRRGIAVALAAGLALAALSPTVRERIHEKQKAFSASSLDRILTRRLAGWHAAATLFREQPLTGSGLGTFPARYYELRLAALHADPELVSRESQVKTFGEAHNDPLQWLGEAGIAGAVPLFALTLLVAASSLASARSGGDPLPLAVIVPMLLASLFQFPFQTAVTALPFLYFAGRALRPKNEPELPLSTRPYPIGTALAVLTMFAAIFLSIRALRELRGSTEEAAAAAFASESAQRHPDLAGPLLRRALELGESAMRDNPTSINAASIVAGCYVLRGDSAVAEAALRRARALEPRVDFDFELAKILWARGDQTEARKLYQDVFLYDPTFAQRMDRSQLEQLGRDDLVKRLEIE